MPVTGAAGFFDLARDLREAGAKDLHRELGRALDAAVRPLDQAIRTRANQVMPAGYRPALTSSLRVRASRAQLRLRVVVSAKGRSDYRDLPSLDAGRLRHPVHGRSRRLRNGGRMTNPWAVTTIRPGFVTRTFTESRASVEREIGAAVGRVAAQIAKG